MWDTRTGSAPSILLVLLEPHYRNLSVCSNYHWYHSIGLTYFLIFLQRECKTLQFESMPDFAKSVPASKLRDFLEKSCMQPFQKDHLDAGLCVAVLRGLKEALSTKDLPQAVTLLLYQCLERSYLAIMTSSHTVEVQKILIFKQNRCFCFQKCVHLFNFYRNSKCSLGCIICPTFSPTSLKCNATDFVYMNSIYHNVLCWNSPSFICDTHYLPTFSLVPYGTNENVGG